MTSIFRALFHRFPRLKARLKWARDRFLPNVFVSSHYVEMDRFEAAAAAACLRGAWQAEELPQRQRVLVNRQLAKYRRGVSVDVFDVLVSALRSLPSINGKRSLLEVGCSSGFYSEVFSIADLQVDYVGCDYSEAFVALARSLYSCLPFDVEDAAALTYSDESFDVVISGCCLLHIPEYEAAIAETARVAKSYAIFHRTPVVTGRPSQYFRKQAYGVETVEIHFNEPGFISLLQSHGLDLIEAVTLHEECDPADSHCCSATRTYVCRKISR